MYISYIIGNCLGGLFNMAAVGFGFSTSSMKETMQITNGQNKQPFITTFIHYKFKMR